MRLALGFSMLLSVALCSNDMFYRLTPDVLAHTLEFLDHDSIVKAVAASSVLRGAAAISIKHLDLLPDFEFWEALPLLDQLASLHLHFPVLTPPALQSLGQMTSLRSLTIETNLPFDCSFLAHLPNLEELTIPLDVIGNFYAPLPNLKKLTITLTGSASFEIFPDQLAVVRQAPNLESLEIESEILFSLDFLAASTKLQELRLCLRRLDESLDLEILTHLTNLKVLELRVNSDLPLEPLRRLFSLERLRVAASEAIVEFDLDLVRNSPNSRHLDILSCKPVNVHFLEFMTELRGVHVNLRDVENAHFLASLVNLKELGVRSLTHTDVLQNLHNLEILNSSLTEIVDLSVFEILPKLRILKIQGDDMRNLDFKWIGKLTRLTSFSLRLTRRKHKSRLAVDLGPLRALRHLTKISIENFAVNSLEPLRNAKELRSLTLWNCEISDLSPVGRLPHLEKVLLFESTITDISGLSELTSLKFLNLGMNTKVTEYGAVRSLPKLKYIS